jgi:hypothetical protein
MEMLQRRTRRNTGISGFIGAGDDAGDSGSATIISGPYMQNLPVAGLTVGEIRYRLGTRLDIARGSIAVIDGHDVSDETVLRSGSCLVFVSRAGEKGAGKAQRQIATSSVAAKMEDEVGINGDRVIARTPEGVQAEMPLTELLHFIRQRDDSLRDVCWPDGVRHVFAEWPMAVVAMELPAAVHRVKWISKDSPKPYGKGCIYEMRSLAMPYIIFMATFAWHPSVTGDEQPGGLRLTQRCEVFMRQAPLQSLDDELMLPVLLNCSKYKSTDGRFDVPDHNISWFCNQYQPIAPYDPFPINARLRKSLVAAVYYLLHTGFNRSNGDTNPAAYAEECSWYDYTVRQTGDPRISDVELWEKESVINPLFIMDDVKLLKSGFTLREVALRILRMFNVRPKISSTADIARLVLNYVPGGRVPKITYPHSMWPTVT